MTLLAHIAVDFYRFVHARLGLPGAGVLLRSGAKLFPGLQRYPLALPGLGIVPIDCRDSGGFSLLNASLGELGNEEQLCAAMERYLPAGSVLWDIGANVGVVVAHFAQPRFQLQAIEAFEPGPAALSTLEGFPSISPKVRVHAVAVGAEDGNAEFFVHKSSSELSRLTTEQHPGGELRTVPVRSGDSIRLSDKLPLPNVIKIDVEGAEPGVFAGLQRTIAEARPVIFFEHIHLTEDQIRAFVPSGYQLEFLLDSGEFTADWSRRYMGHDAILRPV